MKPYCTICEARAITSWPDRSNLENPFSKFPQLFRVSLELPVSMVFGEPEALKPGSDSPLDLNVGSLINPIRVKIRTFQLLSSRAGHSKAILANTKR